MSVPSPFARGDFLAWLRKDNVSRYVLIEIDYVTDPNSDGTPTTETLYYSNLGYFDSVRFYEDCINSVPQYQRSLSGPVATTFSSSIGSIEIDNADGDKDFILGLPLDGSEVRCYLGDDTIGFQLIFRALSVKATAPSFDRISIQLKDANLLLNKSIGGTDIIGGTGPNADQWRPVNFGYVHNLFPKVFDTGTLTYVHADTGTDVTLEEVRDRGVSVGFTDNSDGTFDLTSSPAGIVTCDVFATRNSDPLTYRVSDLMAFLIEGRAGMNASARDPSRPNSDFYAGPGPTYFVNDLEDYFIGLSIAESRNLIDVLDQVCDTGLCFWAVNRQGGFTYGRLRPENIAYFGIIKASITEDDIDEGSWRLENAAPQYYLLQAYMSRNWYQQTDFAGVLTPDEQAVFTRLGIYLLQSSAISSPGRTYFEQPQLYHKTLSISPALDTILSGSLGTGDLPALLAWENTRLAMQLPWLQSVSVTVGAEYAFLELGDPVVITSSRYDLDAGVLFQVTSININLTSAKVDLVLLRRLVEGFIPYYIYPASDQLFIEGNAPVVTNSSSPVVGPFVPGTRALVLSGIAPVWSRDSYNFDTGGVTQADILLTADLFFPDFINVPVWWDFSGSNILVHEDVADDAGGNIGATVDVLFNPLVTGLYYPGYFLDASTISQIAFSDGSTWPNDGTVIDYTSITGTSYSARVIVPAGPYSPGTDLTLGNFQMQYWIDYDIQPGEVAFAATILGGNTAYVLGTGHLLVTIQNRSGSTITAADDGSSGDILINLPTNAVDPDAPTGAEIDVSFVGGAATCLQNNSGGTVSVGGDRHQLQLSISGMSILDGEHVQLIFPVVFSKGSDNGWLGFTNTEGRQLSPLPSFTSTVGVGGATVKLFTDGNSLLFIPNN